LPDSNADLLRYYRAEIKFQSELLGNRLGSFMTSQSFLLIAYASAMSGLIGQWQNVFALLFPPCLALLGIILAFSALPGMRAAYIVIEQWHRRQFDLLQRDPSMEGYYLTSASEPLVGERDLAPETRLQQGTIFAKHTPWIFITVWSYFGLLPIALYFLA
jgi:hypothetical protein